jgi:hypothetical protein
MEQAEDLSKKTLAELQEDRKALLERQLDYTRKLNEFKSQLTLAKSNAHTKRKYMSPHSYDELNKNIKTYGAELQRFQMQLGTISKEVARRNNDANLSKTIRLEQHIMRLCKEKMSKEEWTLIVDEAMHDMREGLLA